jgi:hypothetical protein
MKRYLTVILLMSIAATACHNTDQQKEKKFDGETYEKSKESLGDKEKNNPSKFLSVEHKTHKNLIGQTVVKGTITNSASVCTYKDVEIKLTFFSKTGVKLDEAIENVYEVIPPGETVKFKTKEFATKGTDSVAVEIMKATGDLKN